MEIKVVGIDIGKTVFHLLGMNGSGKIVVKNRFSRPQLLAAALLSRACAGWGGAPSPFEFLRSL